jgi:hypothetical protein
MPHSNPSGLAPRVPKLSYRNRLSDDFDSSSSSIFSRAETATTSNASISNDQYHSGNRSIHEPKNPRTTDERSVSSGNSDKPCKTLHPMSSTPAKKKKGGMLGFLSLKEPSANALAAYADSQRKQASEKGKSVVGLGGVSQAKLPSHIPKTNSKWDGLPHPEKSDPSSPYSFTFSPGPGTTFSGSSRASLSTHSSNDSGEKKPKKARHSAANLSIAPWLADYPEGRRSSVAPEVASIQFQTGVSAVAGPTSSSSISSAARSTPLASATHVPVSEQGNVSPITQDESALPFDLLTEGITKLIIAEEPEKVDSTRGNKNNLDIQELPVPKPRVELDSTSLPAELEYTPCPVELDNTAIIAELEGSIPVSNLYMTPSGQNIGTPRQYEDLVSSDDASMRHGTPAPLSQDDPYANDIAKRAPPTPPPIYVYEPSNTTYPAEKQENASFKNVSESLGVGPKPTEARFSFHSGEDILDTEDYTPKNHLSNISDIKQESSTPAIRPMLVQQGHFIPFLAGEAQELQLPETPPEEKEFSFQFPGDTDMPYSQNDLSTSTAPTKAKRRSIPIVVASPGLRSPTSSIADAPNFSRPRASLYIRQSSDEDVAQSELPTCKPMPSKQTSKERTSLGGWTKKAIPIIRGAEEPKNTEQEENRKGKMSRKIFFSKS